MKLLTAIVNLFKKNGIAPSSGDQRWVDGYDNFQKGKELYLERKLQEAVDYFDRAIEINFEEGGIYGLRGSCLQCLNFHFDAIDDFTKAIASEPNDCNLYYMRSVSRGATGDLQGRVSDLNEAIRLAIVHSALNNTYDKWAREKGYTCVANKFNFDLMDANLDLEAQAQDESRLREHPNVVLGPDLVTRRRAQSKRRTTL